MATPRAIRKAILTQLHNSSVNTVDNTVILPTTTSNSTLNTDTLRAIHRDPTALLRDTLKDILRGTLNSTPRQVPRDITRYPLSSSSSLSSNHSLSSNNLNSHITITRAAANKAKLPRLLKPHRGRFMLVVQP